MERLFYGWLAQALRIVIFFGAIVVAPGNAAAQARDQSGAEVCKACHAGYVESYLTTKHGQSGNVRGPDCLSCHGQGALEHAKQGGGRGVGVLGDEQAAFVGRRPQRARVGRRALGRDNEPARAIAAIGGTREVARQATRR